MGGISPRLDRLIQSGDYHAITAAISQDTCIILDQTMLAHSSYTLDEDDDLFEVHVSVILGASVKMTRQDNTLTGEVQVEIYNDWFEPCPVQIKVTGRIKSPTALDLTVTGESASLQCDFQYTISLEKD